MILDKTRLSTVLQSYFWYVYLEVSPIDFNETYSQLSVHRAAATHFLSKCHWTQLGLLLRRQSAAYQASLFYSFPPRSLTWCTWFSSILSSHHPWKVGYGERLWLAKIGDLNGWTGNYQVLVWHSSQWLWQIICFPTDWTIHIKFNPQYNYFRYRWELKIASTHKWRKAKY